MATQFNQPSDVPATIGGLPIFLVNATEEFNTFLRAAYQFAVWVAQTDDHGYNPISGGKPFTFEVTDAEREGQELWCSGIEIWAGDWFADAWAYFAELMHNMPLGRPDGELDINVPLPPAGQPMLLLWHD